MGGKLSGLAELAYEAALDDGLWESWSEAMLHHFEGRLAVMGLVDQPRGAMRRVLFIYPGGEPDAILTEYAGGMAVHDPILRQVSQARGSRIFDEREAVDWEKPEDRDYMGWQLDRFGIRHNLTAVVALGGGLQAGIALNRGPDAGPAGSAEREQLAALFPHFARAMKLGLRHNEMLQQAWWEGHQNEGDGAAVLLDEHGLVLRMSAAAERIVGAKDGFGVSGNRLIAAGPDCDIRLRALVGRAVADRGGEAGAATIKRPSGRKSYRLAIWPLVRGRRFLAPNEAAALVRLIDPAASRRRMSSLQRALFGLTDREAEVADLLLAGHSLDSLAAELGIRRNTVRIHLQSLFRKTETNRQSDLIRLLMTS